MLAPTERSLLLDHFRPPDGYRFDSAIGTTYSLDLVALMMVPLAFTFLDIETAAGEPVDGAMAPLAMLEALRRHDSTVTLFCHAGGIAVPARHRPLCTYLEDSVRGQSDTGATMKVAWPGSP